jgi:hypothetical protein
LSGYYTDIFVNKDQCQRRPAGQRDQRSFASGLGAIYVLSGETTIRWPDRTDVAGAGDSLVGAAPHTAMEAASTGDEDLVELIMFVVDSTLPFKADATLE